MTRSCGGAWEIAVWTGDRECEKPIGGLALVMWPNQPVTPQKSNEFEEAKFLDVDRLWLCLVEKVMRWFVCRNMLPNMKHDIIFTSSTRLRKHLVPGLSWRRQITLKAAAAQLDGRRCGSPTLSDTRLQPRGHQSLKARAKKAVGLLKKQQGERL